MLKGGNAVQRGNKMAQQKCTEKPQARLRGRLVPPSGSYPDCLCVLTLTRENIAVREDFPGAADDLFCIPRERLVRVAHYEREKQALNQIDVTVKGAKLAVTAMEAMVVLPADMRAGRYVKYGCVELCWRDDEGTERALFFTELSGGVRAFVKKAAPPRAALSGESLGGK